PLAFLLPGATAQPAGATDPLSLGQVFRADLGLTIPDRDRDEVRAAVAGRAIHGEQEARDLLVLAHVPQLNLRGEVADEAHTVHAANLDRKVSRKRQSFRESPVAKAR